jgi:hypothetical protein
MGAAEVMALLQQLLRGLVAGTVEPEEEPPEGAQAFLDDLLSRVDTYRDAALIVLAYAVDAGTGADVATPPAGRRTVGQGLAALFDDLNIRARRDAFQTLAKGTTTLSGRERHAWNDLLTWAHEQDEPEPIDQAMRYMATRIVATARNLPPMPQLDVAQLTFRRVVSVVDDLLAVSSGGAHEQFLLASLLHALAEEHGGRTVKTKMLSASDASAGTAADVQVLDGGKVVEAYEVTANDWSSKVPQAVAVLRDYDLPRVHIVAPGPAPSGPAIKEQLGMTLLAAGRVPSTIDLSVLDVNAECRSLVHRLSRPGRRAALNKLWEHLALRQPRDELVARYVARLREGHLVSDG